MTYMVCNGFGDQLCDGLTEDAALARAQDLANSLGESVWVYGPDDTDETATEVTPE